MNKFATSRPADYLRRSKLRIPVSKWRHRRLRPGDVVLASYPRSGSTWTAFMLAELLTGSEVDFYTNTTVIPAVGKHFQAPSLLPRGGRLMRSHEPYRTAYRRAIYLVRDVRDVAISFRTLRASLGFNDADLDKYLSRFVSGHIAGYGSWQDHVNGWLTAADSNPNILVVRYEDLVDDTVARLGEMAAFLKFSCDDGRLRQVIENNRPDHMRSRATDYSDERMAATVGDGTYARWKEHYSPHQLDIFTPTSQVITLAGYR